MEFIAIKDAANVNRNVGGEFDTANTFVQAFIGFQGNSIQTPVNVTATAAVAVTARANRCAMRIQNLGDEEVAFKYAADPSYTAGVPDAAFVIRPGGVEWFYFGIDSRAIHAVRASAGTSRVLFLEWELP